MQGQKYYGFLLTMKICRVIIVIKNPIQLININKHNALAYYVTRRGTTFIWVSFR